MDHVIVPLDAPGPIWSAVARARRFVRQTVRTQLCMPGTRGKCTAYPKHNIIAGARWCGIRLGVSHHWPDSVFSRQRLRAMRSARAASSRAQLCAFRNESCTTSNIMVQCSRKLSMCMWCARSVPLLAGKRYHSKIVRRTQSELFLPKGLRSGRRWGRCALRSVRHPGEPTAWVPSGEHEHERIDHVRHVQM